MSTYKTIVVGTDGSKSSLLAVERAAGIASAFGAKLIIGVAYYENEDQAAKTLRKDSIQVMGDHPAHDILNEAKAAADAVGATDVQTVIQPGTPVEALMTIVTDNDADLLVVGNRGINTLTGRLVGSVPADVARQSECDVMIVHTVQ